VKKFKFKLQPILRYRQILKDLQEAKVIRANQACNETERDLDKLQVRQHLVYESMIENAEEAFSLDAHRNYQTYNHMIINERSKEKTRLAKRKKSHEFEQKKFINTSKNLKAIEKLQDKALELHQKEILKLEMKQMDDLVNGRYRAHND
jgi:flagellar export protein FliJ